MPRRSGRGLSAVTGCLPCPALHPQPAKQPGLPPAQPPALPSPLPRRSSIRRRPACRGRAGQLHPPTNPRPGPQPRDRLARRASIRGRTRLWCGRLPPGGRPVRRGSSERRVGPAGWPAAGGCRRESLGEGSARSDNRRGGSEGLGGDLPEAAVGAAPPGGSYQPGKCCLESE
jgi:hypothetical protein